MKQASQLLTSITKRLYPQARAMSLSAIDRVGARELTSTDKETASLVPEILDAYARDAAVQAARLQLHKPALAPVIPETHDQWKGDRDDFGPERPIPRAAASSRTFQNGIIRHAASKSTLLQAPSAAPTGKRMMSIFGMPDYDPVPSDNDPVVQQVYKKTMETRQQLELRWMKEGEKEAADRRAATNREIARLHNELHGLTEPQADKTPDVARTAKPQRPFPMPASKTSLFKQVVLGATRRHYSTEEFDNSPSAEQEKWERRQRGEQQEKQARAAREQRKWLQEQQDKTRTPDGGKSHAESISQERKSPASHSKG